MPSQTKVRAAAVPVTIGDYVVNNHDPRHLRDEFERDWAGGYGWEYVERGPVWPIRVTRLSAGPPARLLGDVTVEAAPDAAGAVWKLQMGRRDLDANIVQLPAGDSIAEHAGGEVDVLLLVLDGAGSMVTEAGEVALTVGQIAWLPKGSRRGFRAGAAGLRYLTVHQRRQALTLTAR